MTFFVLIPLYWFVSITMYAASPRQQIIKQRNQAIVSALIAWMSFVVINGVCFFGLTWNGWSMIVAAITLLLINMLILPSCIILLAHKPQWLIHSSLSIMGLCALAQLVAQGHLYVA